MPQIPQAGKRPNLLEYVYLHVAGNLACIHFSTRARVSVWTGVGVYYRQQQWQYTYNYSFAARRYIW